MMFVPREAQAQAQTLSQGESTNPRSKAPGARAGADGRAKNPAAGIARKAEQPRKEPSEA